MPLEACRILVTRPTQQSHHLMQLIKEKGGYPVHFPVIEIEDLSADNLALQQLQQQLPHYQKLLFVSANAVLYSLPWLLKYSALPQQLQLVVVGKTTEKTVHQYLDTAVICPPRFNSESLLDLTEFDPQTINKKRIAIIKGVGGRHLLTNTLRQRGALVDEIKVYRRCLPANPPVVKIPPQCIVITSGEGLHNLFKLLPDSPWLAQTPMVLISARLEQTARDLGVVAPLFVAPQACDAGLLTALLTWRESHA